MRGQLGGIKHNPFGENVGQVLTQLLGQSKMLKVKLIMQLVSITGEGSNGFQWIWKIPMARPH